MVTVILVGPAFSSDWRNGSRPSTLFHAQHSSRPHNPTFSFQLKHHVTFLQSLIQPHVFLPVTLIDLFTLERNHIAVVVEKAGAVHHRKRDGVRAE